MTDEGDMAPAEIKKMTSSQKKNEEVEIKMNY